MVLSIKSFSKSYGKTNVIKNISVDIATPQTIGLIGDNGAGKTTLLKCIAKFINNYEGTITSDASITSSIEFPAFFDNLSVYENLKFVEKLTKKESAKSIDEVLKFVKLDAHVKKKFRALSMGMQQKLVIARMMLNDSDVYLLDEPFNGLDVSTKKELLAILQKLKQDGKTLIISSHILDELSALSDAVWYLKNGQLIQNIDLHTSTRKYNIVIKMDDAGHILTDNQLAKLAEELNIPLKKLKETNESVVLRMNILQADISSSLNKLVAKGLAVIEFYDVTDKLDDYMSHDGREGDNYENVTG
jgi:ABC-2 type transport system ATP-binding protein